jgi:hypothetical protein
VWLAVWLGLGLLIFFLYERKHSHMNTHLAHESDAHGVPLQGSAEPSDPTVNE